MFFVIIFFSCEPESWNKNSKIDTHKIFNFLFSNDLNQQLIILKIERQHMDDFRVIKLFFFAKSSFLALWATIFCLRPGFYTIMMIWVFTIIESTYFIAFLHYFKADCTLFSNFCLFGFLNWHFKLNYKIDVFSRSAKVWRLLSSSKIISTKILNENNPSDRIICWWYRLFCGKSKLRRMVSQ